MQKSQWAAAIIVAVIVIYCVTQAGWNAKALTSSLLLISIGSLLWQTILSFGSEIEPLDFFPGTVLLLISLLLHNTMDSASSSWAPAIALAMLVGLGVLFRPFHENQPEIDEQQEE